MPFSNVFKPTQPLREQFRTRQEFNIPLTKYHVEHTTNTGKKRTPNLKQANWSGLKNLRHKNTGRVRLVSTSSSFKTSTSRNYASRSGAKYTTTDGGSSMLESAAGGSVVAVTTGRGDARSEVGIAALDIRCPHLILCQISDSQTYTNALSKLYLFEPVEILMPDTMSEGAKTKNMLYRSITDKFPGIEITAISRIHFNDTIGFERVKSLCNAEYSSVELFIKQKYYALAAVSALLKYVEYVQHVVYTPKSMKIEFQGSPNAITIDLESARSLELVQSQCGQKNASLLGILDRCSTPMGRKLLRANILQPSSEERIILERQAAIAELVSNRSLRALIQPIVRRLYGADRLLALSTSPLLHENSVQCAEHNLNYVLLLKHLLDVVPELASILLTSKSDLFRKIQTRLVNDEYRLMQEKILETIHSDARSVAGYTSASMQRCFAIKAGINDLLDVARQTYCELIDDMKTMVENLADKYKLTLSLSCNASLGFHIQAILPRNSNFEAFTPPYEFIEVQKSKQVYTMTTSALAALSQQCKIACEELHLMSNVLLCDLLQNIREYIGRLFQLSGDVAELDLIISLAQVSSCQTYVKPTFGSKLELLDSRHPIMDVIGLDGPIPNNITASIFQNLYIISGPNMSGKSTYLKQIVLLHIMAQLGCFVPAKKAMFRITNFIFCKIAVRDDVECNASTFALEIKEAQYILRSVTPTSVIILDELCKGTAIEEGASIAWAICEKLSNTTAFTFVATHFTYLTKLADLYYNVTNQHFETVNLPQRLEMDECHHRITYTHRLKLGVTLADDYGIVLAQLSGLPKSVTEKARKCASEHMIANQITIQSNRWQKTCYNVLVKLYELLETDKFEQEQVASLIQRFVTLWIQKDNNDEEGETALQENNGELKEQLKNAITFPKPTTTQQTQQTQTKHHAHETTVPKHISTLSTEYNALSRNPSNHSLALNDSTFYSITTENASNESSSVIEFVEPPNSMCFTTNETVRSPSFKLQLSPTQVSMTTIEMSPSKLYEYCLSDEDFEPLNMSHVSIITNVQRTDSLNTFPKNCFPLLNDLRKKFIYDKNHNVKLSDPRVRKYYSLYFIVRTLYFLYIYCKLLSEKAGKVFYLSVIDTIK
ncbi:mutS protein homolog 4 [Xylocopa sonorina]|uniref:mutS protein homolog 4 n=1 Tax=Xylocopa sonorina TaxID=1818115 RepID=UPI00403AB58C